MGLVFEMPMANPGFGGGEGRHLVYKIIPPC